MQGDKINGKIDDLENLIILQTEQIVSNSTETATESQQKTLPRPTKIKALEGWFEKTQPASPDFDPMEARWEALKEKYNF